MPHPQAADSDMLHSLHVEVSSPLRVGLILEETARALRDLTGCRTVEVAARFLVHGREAVAMADEYLDDRSGLLGLHVRELKFEETGIWLVGFKSEVDGIEKEFVSMEARAPFQYLLAAGVAVALARLSNQAIHDDTGGWIAKAPEEGVSLQVFLEALRLRPGRDDLVSAANEVKARLPVSLPAA